MNVDMILDGGGVYGSLLHYALVIAFAGSALLAFLYYWRKGQLNMDEEAKFQMLQAEDQIKQEEECDDSNRSGRREREG